MAEEKSGHIENVMKEERLFHPSEEFASQARIGSIEEYEELFSNPYRAAERGYVDAVLVPNETRKGLIRSLDAMRNKRETRPAKKHGNIPV